MQENSAESQQMRGHGGCCAPRRPVDPSHAKTTAAAVTPGRGTGAAERSSVGSDAPRGMVVLGGGPFLMGSEGPLTNPGEGEGPVREITVDPFLIDETAVTNRRFSVFVKETGYVTDAERYGWSFVFVALLSAGAARRVEQRVANAPWWCVVEGAYWKAPEGPGSQIGDRPNHPVVHVSWNDAVAYCEWVGRRLPTEAEWEYAARGGLEGMNYPWGDELLPNGRWRLNIWQGTFPSVNTLDDGHLGSAPVKTYPANGYGLYEMCGNVWEWTADRWSVDFHASGPGTNPTGPPDGDERVRRGGSYLCHDSYCNRYRVTARDHNRPDDATGNCGFRCAADL